MNDPEIVKLLIRKDERITALEEENRKLREGLEVTLDMLKDPRCEITSIIHVVKQTLNT